MKYNIYLRVSTDEQDIATQRDRCLKYVSLINTNRSECLLFEDDGVSSKIGMDSRLGLRSMLDGIKKGDVVVTSKLDRLSRDIIEMVSIHRAIMDRGATLYSLSEPEIQPWMLGIFGSMAQKEREDISARTKQKLKAMKERGERTGHVPYGKMLAENIYRSEENKGTPIRLIDSPQEQETLKVMHDMRKRKIPFRVMQNLLNERGYSNRGNPWTHSAISRVIKNLSQKS